MISLLQNRISGALDGTFPLKSASDFLAVKLQACYYVTLWEGYAEDTTKGPGRRGISIEAKSASGFLSFRLKACYNTTWGSAPSEANNHNPQAESLQ